MIGKLSYHIKTRIAQLKRVCVLTPKGDIGPHSGVAEQLFIIDSGNLRNDIENFKKIEYNKGELKYHMGEND